MRTDVSPGVAKLILFGNVGETGQSGALDLSGSNLDGMAWSAAARAWRSSRNTAWADRAGFLQ